MNNKINWEEVEQKISLICYRFSNLESWHDDLAQELRIHAYYVSDNYYDLHRKAIDFWRKIKNKQSPEIPYFDLEVLNQSTDDSSKSIVDLENLITLVRKELKRPGENKWDNDKLALANRLFNIIIADIHPAFSEEVEELNSSSLNHYINHRLNLSWVSEETGIGYKRIVVAMKLLEDIIRGLAAMHKIELSTEYFEGYFG